MRSRRARPHRVVVAAFVATAVAAVLFPHVYARRATLVVGLRKDMPSVMTGFYPAERSPAGTSFAWTGPHARVALDGIDRRVAWTVSMRVMVWRPAGVPLPEVRLLMDGVERLAEPLTRDFTRVEVTAPARPGTSGLTLDIEVRPPFTPGTQDTRTLGVAVDEFVLAPLSSRVRPPVAAWWASVVAAGALAAAFAGVGLSAALAVGVTLPLVAVESLLATYRFAPYLDFAQRAAVLAVGVALALVGAGRVVERRRRSPLGPHARFVAVYSAAASYARLLVLLHPDMPTGDALFHAHRLEYVLAGRFYFTSLAPGDYAFPYPIALYLAAAPFALWTSDPAHHIVLLRTVVTAADTLVGIALFLLARRAWGDPLAGAAAAVLYSLLPLGARTMEWGNLTNMFGQSLFVAAVVLMASPWLRNGDRRRVASLGGVMAAACLSHPSTCAILVALGMFTAALSWRRTDSESRSFARAVLVATGAASLLAFALYYAWFALAYRSAAVRIGSELAAAAAQPAWSRLWHRVSEVPVQLVQHHGLPALLLATVGAWRVWHQVPEAGVAAGRLRLVLGAWALSCAVFLVVGILTPIDLRYYLAGLPAVAIVAGVGWGYVWRERPRARPVLVFLAGWMLWIGVRVRVGIFA